MLKTFEQRVEATFNYMLGLLTFTHVHASEIIELRNNTKSSTKTQSEFAITWQLDNSQADTIIFKGYEAARLVSKITGQMRLKYDRTKPYSKEIP